MSRTWKGAAKIRCEACDEARSGETSVKWTGKLHFVENPSKLNNEDHAMKCAPAFAIMFNTSYTNANYSTGVNTIANCFSK